MTRRSLLSIVPLLFGKKAVPQPAPSLGVCLQHLSDDLWKRRRALYKSTIISPSGSWTGGVLYCGGSACESNRQERDEAEAWRTARKEAAEETLKPEYIDAFTWGGLSPQMRRVVGMKNAW